MADETTPVEATPSDALGRRRDQRHIGWGIVLIALGLLMLGDQLQIGMSPWGIRLNLGRLWPVVLIVLGVVRLTFAGDGRARRGYWLLFLGGLFLLHTYDVLTLRDSWPLFVVAGGVSIIFGDRAGRRRGC